MQIEIEISRKEKATVEVSFPLFVTYGDSFDGGGGYECYARIDGSLTRHEIHEDQGGEWQYGVDKIGRETLGRIASPQHYAHEFAGYSYSKISADEFYAKVNEFRAALAAIPR